jgi:hypothetical protein
VKGLYPCRLGLQVFWVEELKILWLHLLLLMLSLLSWLLLLVTAGNRRYFLIILVGLRLHVMWPIIPASNLALVSMLPQLPLLDEIVPNRVTLILLQELVGP